MCTKCEYWNEDLEECERDFCPMEECDECVRADEPLDVDDAASRIAEYYITGASAGDTLVIARHIRDALKELGVSEASTY